jgi:predicted transposase YdaD
MSEQAEAVYASQLHYARSEGRQEGKLETRREVAANMFREGIPLEVVSRVTGLPAEELTQIQAVNMVDKHEMYLRQMQEKAEAIRISQLCYAEMEGWMRGFEKSWRESWEAARRETLEKAWAEGMLEGGKEVITDILESSWEKVRIECRRSAARKLLQERGDFSAVQNITGLSHEEMSALKKNLSPAAR